MVTSLRSLRKLAHYTLLLGPPLIGMSTLIEARCYRHLRHSKWRLHLIEAGYFAGFIGGATVLALTSPTLEQLESWSDEEAKLDG